MTGWDRPCDDVPEIGYRLVVDGHLTPERLGWLGGRAVDSGPATTFDIRVRDQADLLGRLRQIHDLQLRLVSLRRTDAPTPPIPRTDP